MVKQASLEDRLADKADLANQSLALCKSLKRSLHLPFLDTMLRKAVCYDLNVVWSILLPHELKHLFLSLHSLHLVINNSARCC